jgi:hypothetical protein
MTAVATVVAEPRQAPGRGKTFVDENTGRLIRQLTDFPTGAHLSYFRYFKTLPDGRLLIRAKHDDGFLMAMDVASGDLEPIRLKIGDIKLRERDGRMWLLRYQDAPDRKRGIAATGREIWQIDLPHGEPVLLAKVPDEAPGAIEDITIDGRYLIMRVANQDLTKTPIPTTKDLASINAYFQRPRSGALWTYELATGKSECILETEGICPLHVDTSPSDPDLIRYCQDMPETQGQRIWTIRRDGSDRHLIRAQARGEMVTHEFWWADPNFIGYTYQDRRQDPTVADHHWAEYAIAKTRLGVANLAGQEVWLSDPLDSYHSHIYRSNDGKWACFEGTEGNSFVYAAPFSWQSTRMDQRRLATIHTPYVPFRGQGVDCNFSNDSRYLVYADKLSGTGVHQLYAVEVD